MAILLKRRVWRRRNRRRARNPPSQLWDEQANNVLAALFKARERHPSWERLRAEFGVGHTVFLLTVSCKARPEAGLAVRLARSLGVTVYDVLTGRFARMLCCVLCEQLSPPTVEGQRRFRASEDWRGPGVCPMCLQAYAQRLL